MEYEFTTIECHQIKGRGYLHHVRVDDDFLENVDPCTLVDKIVVLDGERVRVRAVEQHAIHWRPGSEAFRNIGLLVQTINVQGLNKGGVQRVSWVAEAEKMRANPGEWQRLADRQTRARAYTLLSQVNRGVLYSFRPAGDFEAKRIHSEVWARYLGDGA